MQLQKIKFLFLCLIGLSVSMVGWGMEEKDYATIASEYITQKNKLIDLCKKLNQQPESTELQQQYNKQYNNVESLKKAMEASYQTLAQSTIYTQNNMNNNTSNTITNKPRSTNKYTSTMNFVQPFNSNMGSFGSERNRNNSSAALINEIQPKLSQSIFSFLSLGENYDNNAQAKCTIVKNNIIKNRELLDFESTDIAKVTKITDLEYLLKQRNDQKRVIDDYIAEVCNNNYTTDKNDSDLEEEENSWDHTFSNDELNKIKRAQNAIELDRKKIENRLNFLKNKQQRLSKKFKGHIPTSKDVPEELRGLVDDTVQKDLFKNYSAKIQDIKLYPALTKAKIKAETIVWADKRKKFFTLANAGNLFVGGVEVFRDHFAGNLARVSAEMIGHAFFAGVGYLVIPYIERLLLDKNIIWEQDRQANKAALDKINFYIKNQPCNSDQNLEKIEKALIVKKQLKNKLDEIEEKQLRLDKVSQEQLAKFQIEQSARPKNKLENLKIQKLQHQRRELEDKIRKTKRLVDETQRASDSEAKNNFMLRAKQTIKNCEENIKKIDIEIMQKYSTGLDPLPNQEISSTPEDVSLNTTSIEKSPNNTLDDKKRADRKSRLEELREKYKLKPVNTIDNKPENSVGTSETLDQTDKATDITQTTEQKMQEMDDKKSIENEQEQDNVSSTEDKEHLV